MAARNQFALLTTSHLGDYLRALRRGRGFTQAQLGARLGVTGARISDIERDPSMVGFAQILTLLHTLGARAFIEVSEAGSLEPSLPDADR
jgi:HTH-type transcriptional regulator / antitoxin HipB